MNFDRVAPVYQWLEYLVFGRALEHARVRWLDEIGHATRCLVIGDGDGRFVSQLVQRYGKLEIDCVENSARMIELAQCRLQSTQIDTSSVRFIQEDIRHWTPAGPYDLVVTHFFLDCFDKSDLEKIVPRIAASLCPSGVWLLADFTIPKRGPGKALAQFLIPIMYAFFRVSAGLRTRRLIDPTEALIASGLNCDRRALSFGGIVKSERWTLNNVQHLSRAG